MKSPPDISVVIPVHNGSRYLAAAIESVLVQTIPVRELIVVDDGSTDDSGQVAASYGDQVTCLSLPHRGPAAARNAGVERTTGQWLAFLDADDLWLPDKLARQLALAVSTSARGVTGGWENFLSPDVDPAASPAGSFPTGIQTNPTAGTLLICRQQFAEIGPFDETLQAGEFIDWVLRARRAGLRFSGVPEIVLKRRIHATNSTRQQAARNRSYFDLIRKHRSSAPPSPQQPPP